MTLLLRVALEGPPLVPSPDEARSELRRELVDPAYHQQNVVERVLTWLERTVGRGLDAASGTPPLSTLAAMVVLVLLVVGLGLLLSRARRTARSAREARPVLEDTTVSAADLRARAEAALAAGSHEEALVEAFRALTVRQVEQGRLDDAPGATAHEVAVALAGAFPHQRRRVDAGAEVFDSVRYGDRRATREQAVELLALDDELAAVLR